MNRTKAEIRALAVQVLGKRHLNQVTVHSEKIQGLWESYLNCNFREFYVKGHKTKRDALNELWARLVVLGRERVRNITKLIAQTRGGW